MVGSVTDLLARLREFLSGLSAADRRQVIVALCEVVYEDAYADGAGLRWAPVGVVRQSHSRDGAQR
jgi:hypothetical protein